MVENASHGVDAPDGLLPSAMTAPATRPLPRAALGTQNVQIATCTCDPPVRGKIQPTHDPDIPLTPPRLT